MPKGAQIVDGPVEARKAAREQLDHGADWIKVYMTHRSWVDEEGNLVSQPTLTVEELKAIVDEAHGWGKKVACHAYNGIGLQRALDGGCDSIEHGLELDDAAVAQMVKQGTWLCPTMAAVLRRLGAGGHAGREARPRSASEVHGPSLPQGREGGREDRLRHRRGRLLLDEPDRAGVRAHGRVRHDARWQAIQSATSRAAEMLGMAGQLGVVAPGAYADIVAVQRRPAEGREGAGEGRVRDEGREGLQGSDDRALTAPAPLRPARRGRGRGERACSGDGGAGSSRSARAPQASRSTHWQERTVSSAARILVRRRSTRAILRELDSSASISHRAEGRLPSSAGANKRLVSSRVNPQARARRSSPTRWNASSPYSRRPETRVTRGKRPICSQ